MIASIGRPVRLAASGTPSIRRASRAVVAALGFLLLVRPVAIQSGAPRIGQSPDSEVAPSDLIRCWRRTTASAVRVGEPFTLVVTCTFLDSGSTIVVPDETKLDPATVPVAPFEVLATRRASSVKSADHRFLQIEYDLRLIDEGLFGQDVNLPEIPLEYRVQTRVESGTLSEGIARVYVLPPQPVRLLSLVPAGATDIRDASARTFRELEAASLRARVLVTSGGVLIGLATLLAAVGLVRSRAGARVSVHGPFAAHDGSVLRGIREELAAVRREREASGWEPELAGRALSALRIAGNYLLARETRQREIDPDVEGAEGTLVVAERFGGRRASISASLTAQDVARALAQPVRKRPAPDRRDSLQALELALQRLTRARYGRPGQDAGEPDASLDESLTAGQRLVDELLRERRWIARSIASIKGLSNRTKGRRRLPWRS